MAATGLARKFGARVDAADEQALIRLVREGAIKDPEIDEQPLFHPDAVMTKGYELFAYAGEDLPADGQSDAWVHHLAAIQGPDGQWYNNLPRPPIQTGDIGATALHRLLDSRKIPHEYHLYPGGHGPLYLAEHLDATLEFHSRAFGLTK